MASNSGGKKPGRSAPLLQRPLRKYKEQKLAKDEEFARKLQQEEYEKANKEKADALLAEQVGHVEGQVHSGNGASVTTGADGDLEDRLLAQHLHAAINGEVKEARDADIARELQADFVRYRGMTECDSMLAQQLQRQEEETAKARDNFHQQQRRNFDQLSDENHQMRQQVRHSSVPNQARGINFVQIGAGPQRLGQVRRPHIAIHRQFAPGQVGLPAGEVDPETLLLTMGSGQENNFISIMQDPALLLMALMSRVPNLANNEATIDPEDYEGLWELAERLGEVQRKGISEDEIQHLPSRQFQAGATAGNTDCQICLTGFEQGETIRSLPCTHDYHSNCIDQWLKRNASCPICRQQVRPSGH